MHVDQNTPKDAVHAPRPPSVAAGRGGTTANCRSINYVRRDGSPVSSLTSARILPVNPQASASGASSSSKLPRRTGIGATTPGAPMLCARSRQIAAAPALGKVGCSANSDQ